MAKIGLQTAKFYASHGMYEGEQELLTEFTVDLTVDFPLEEVEHYTIENTIDYEIIYRIIEEEMAQRRDLLETLIRDIAHSVLALDKFIRSVTVRIAKKSPILGGEVAQSFVEMEFEQR